MCRELTVQAYQEGWGEIWVLSQFPASMDGIFCGGDGRGSNEII